jgi:hypothetical protein
MMVNRFSFITTLQAGRSHKDDGQKAESHIRVELHLIVAAVLLTRLMHAKAVAIPQ